MLHKEEILLQIKNAASQNSITKEELLIAYEAGQKNAPIILSHKKINLIDILFYIGGAIVVLGIIVFLTMNWPSLLIPTRILATLGAGIAAYVTGLLLSTQQKTTNLSIAFHFIAACAIPIGLFVTFDAAGYDTSSAGIYTIVSAIMLGFYLTSYSIFKKTVFIVFSIIAGTTFYYALPAYLYQTHHPQNTLYLTLIAGLTYLLLGYYFTKQGHNLLSTILYSLGLLGFFGATFMLLSNFTGFRRSDLSTQEVIIWQILFPFFIAGSLYISTKLKSVPFLAIGSFFLMAYILRITHEYFLNTLGWPLALVLVGLCIIAIGYFTAQFKSKFIKD